LTENFEYTFYESPHNYISLVLSLPTSPGHLNTKSEELEPFKLL